MSTTFVPAKSWFLIYAKPRQEETAKTQLSRQGYGIYLPMTQQTRKRGARRTTYIEPLFPRYLFIHLNTCTDDWGPIRSTVGVSALVRFGKEPALVPDDLVGLLQSRESESGLHVWIAPGFLAGQAVRVTDGVLQGYEGIFVAASGRERAVVLLDILGRKVRARVDTERLEAAE